MSQNFPQDLYKPEKLNLWDRIFNRYKKMPVYRGTENWHIYSYYDPLKQYPTPFIKNYVEYHVIDRLTGSYTIKKEYLN